MQESESKAVTETKPAPPRPSSINWASIFLAFTRGAGPEELAEVFAVPVHLVRQRIKNEGWSALRDSADTLLPAADDSVRRRIEDLQVQKAEARLQQIEDNRRANFEVACALRDDLFNLIRQIQDGTAKVEKLFCHKGEVIRAEQDVSYSDRVNLANYARTIADLSYRALGDSAAAFGAGTRQDGPPGSAAQAAQAGASQINIIIPSVIASDRQSRAEPPGKVKHPSGLEGDSSQSIGGDQVIDVD